MTISLFILLVLIHIILLSIVIYNFISAPKIFNLNGAAKTDDKISILIPVRNEEKNIGRLLDSIISQSFNNFEIIVLDDGSTDNSYQIVEDRIRKGSNITLLRGLELPENWLGKNWACYQLYKQAKSDFLLFVDADVTLKDNALAYTFYLMERHNLSMLSVFPTQIIGSFGERLVVPLMNWLLLTFLPLLQVYKSDKKSFSAANGQYILIKKEIYEEIGTHESLKGRVVEDMELVRGVKEKNYRAMTCLGNGVIFTAMYNSFIDSINGFSKNFFAGFNTSRIMFLLLITFFIIFFLLPFILAIWNTAYLIVVGLIIIERIFVSILSKENIFYNIILHPFQILIMFIIGLKSISRKKKEWKGRTI